MTGDHPNPLLTTVEAADRVRVPKATLVYWRRCEPINSPRFVRVGRRVYYRRDDLEAWVVGTHLPETGGSGT